MPQSNSQQPDLIARLSHVTLRYEHDICALDDLSLSIRRGERVCVLGANGSGKSTLASVLCGLLAPDEGSVELVGHAVMNEGEVDLGAYRAARRELGLVFQNPDDQIVTSVVEDDVAFGPENLGAPPEEITKRVERELHRVALDAYAKADPSRLSGGQQQRVAIAGALAMEPQLLVLDEPGALLDVRGRRSIMRVMAKLHQAGTTLVHITHFMDEALDADRVVVMSHGRIALEGTPNEVFAHADELGKLGLEEPFSLQLARELNARGVVVPFTCNENALREAIAQRLRKAAGQASSPVTNVAPQDAGQAPAEHASKHETGQVNQAGRSHGPGRESRSSTTSHGSDLALSVQNVSYSYGTSGSTERPHLALDQVSFSVPAGTTAAIVGQTGSGKSTLLRIVCALEQPDTGTVLVDGINTADKRERRLIYNHVGYVMQHPERQLFAETVWDDVAYGPTNMGLAGGELDQRVEHALELVGLTGKAEASPFELSGGQKRLCAIAGILAMEPRTLVLDEPTAGLDPRGRRQLRAILSRIHASGVTIVQVTHSMEDAARMNQVVVLNQSHLIEDGTPHAVFAPEHGKALEAAGLGLPLSLAWAHALDPSGSTLGQPLTTEELAEAIADALRVPNGTAERRA